LGKTSLVPRDLLKATIGVPRKLGALRNFSQMGVRRPRWVGAAVRRPDPMIYGEPTDGSHDSTRLSNAPRLGFDTLPRRDQNRFINN
jgi:hypothetical protein